MNEDNVKRFKTNTKMLVMEMRCETSLEELSMMNMMES
jgi:hypothetical protein